MNVFCTNCGAKAEEGAKMCANCGAPLTIPEPIPVYGVTENNNMQFDGEAVSTNDMPVNDMPANDMQFNGGMPANDMQFNGGVPANDMQFNGTMPSANDSATVPTNGNNKKTLAIVAAAAVAVIVLLVVVITAAGSNGYKSVIDNKLKAFEKGDAQKLAKTYPEFLYIDEFDTEEDFIENLEDAEFSTILIDKLEEEVGSKVKLSYKIEKVTDLSEKKFDKFCEAISEAHDCSINKIKAIKKADIKVTAKGKDGKHEFDWEDVYLIKEAGDWYILNMDLENGNIGEKGEYHMDFYESYSYYVD